MAEVVRERNRQYSQQDAWDRFWKDKHGNVVIYQRPNLWLLGWLILTIVSLFTNGMVANVLGDIASGVLVIWSFLEIFKGVNYLRRTLGVIVLALIVFAILKVGY